MKVIKNTVVYLCVFCLLIAVVGLCSSFGCSDNDGDSGDNALNDYSSDVYYAFGDSITFGADNTRGYAPMDNPYPKLVSSELALKSYTNFAVSGSTVATNVDDLYSINTQVKNADCFATIISVMGGVNDFNRDVEIGSIDDNNTDTFYGSYNEICSLLKQKYPNAFIFLMTPYKELGYNSTNDLGYKLIDYVDAVKNMANKYDLKCLDMFSNGNFELEMSCSSSDGIHPSQSFVINYTAPQISQFIKDNYNK